MQLSPSTSPLDSNFLALIPGGATPVAGASGSEGIVPFDQLLPGAEAVPVGASPDAVGASPEALGLPSPVVTATIPRTTTFTRLVNAPQGEPVTEEENVSGETAVTVAQPGVGGKKPAGGMESKTRGSGERPARSKAPAAPDSVVAPVVQPLLTPDMTPPPTVLVSEPSSEIEAAPEEPGVDDLLGGDEHSDDQEGEFEDAPQPGISTGSRPAASFASPQAGEARGSVASQPAEEFSLKVQDDESDLPTAATAEKPVSTKLPAGVARAFAMQTPAGHAAASETTARTPSERPLTRSNLSDSPLEESTTPFPGATFRRDLPVATSDYTGVFNARFRPVSTPAVAPKLSAADANAVTGLDFSAEDVADPLQSPVVARTASELLPAVPTDARGAAVQAQVQSQLVGESDQAKIAANPGEFRNNLRQAKRESQKTFVTTDKEEVTTQSKALGIGAAKPEAIMPARAFSTPTPHSASDYAAVAVGASSERQPLTSETPAAAPQPVATAHQAVEAVLRAVDHASTREQHSVNLRFSVGDSDLNVRVELRADQVHTTFTTDSADLRNALSHEWQSIHNSGVERGFRIAPATFNSSEQSTSNSFSGDASSRDRQHQASRQDASAFASNSPAFGGRSETARESVRTPVHAVAPASSRLLHTLA